MLETDYLTSPTTIGGNVAVSAYHEQLDSDDVNHLLWGYCLRIENNSTQRIRLLKKDLRITDSSGRSFYDSSYGFHGELPDLEPGECFEFEDVTAVENTDAVLYGNCLACTADGSEFKIKLPLMQLLASKSKAYNNKFRC